MYHFSKFFIPLTANDSTFLHFYTAIFYTLFSQSSDPSNVPLLERDVFCRAALYVAAHVDRRRHAARQRLLRALDQD